MYISTERLKKKKQRGDYNHINQFFVKRELRGSSLSSCQFVPFPPLSRRSFPRTSLSVVSLSPRGRLLWIPSGAVHDAGQMDAVGKWDDISEIEEVLDTWTEGQMEGENQNKQCLFHTQE